MRHRCQKYSSFGLKPGPRQALIRGLVKSLVEYERIKITLPRAKDVRRHVEKAITLGKNGNLSSRRLLLSRFPHAVTVSKIMNQLTQRFKDRPGGFTRIIKLGQRSGDQAEMAYLEFIDYDPLNLANKKIKSKDKKQELSALKKESYLKKKKVKKRLRKIEKTSRCVRRSS